MVYICKSIWKRNRPDQIGRPIAHRVPLFGFGPAATQIDDCLGCGCYFKSGDVTL